VAVTRKKSNGDVNLYINGVLKKNGTCNSGNTLSEATTMLIGSETDFPGYTFGGNMGAFLANTSVLTAAQILQNYNAQKAIYGL
jgi:acyl-CoA hydrolase